MTSREISRISAENWFLLRQVFVKRLPVKANSWEMLEERSGFLPLWQIAERRRLRVRRRLRERKKRKNDIRYHI
jgi:hypothetical protein